MEMFWFAGHMSERLDHLSFSAGVEKVTVTSAFN